MRVVAIDPGIRNIAIAIYDNGSLVDAKLCDLTPFKKSTKYAHLAKYFCDQHHAILKDADVIAIECQMQARMKIIATAIQCFYWDTSRLVSPRAVRHHFKISTGVYKDNKKLSIEMVNTFKIPKHVQDTIQRSKKKDDLCDAILIGQYIVNTLKT